MVSIIVPVYNVRNYLDRCMESILNQTFKDIEVILINDGSTDNSDEICVKWQKSDDRIIYISKENEGLGATRNLGVSLAKGDYITFVDSDDWIEEDTIESMYNAAKKFSADIVLCDINYVTIDENDKYIYKTSRLRVKSNVVIDPEEDITLLERARLYFWGKLYKREFYLQADVSQPAHAFEDTAVSPFLIAEAGSICHVPKALYNYYRNRPGSMVNNFKYLGDMKKALAALQDIFKREKIFDKYYETLKKISYSQVKFVYRRLLGSKEEIALEDRYILNDLYEFMDTIYPDWLNMDKVTVGVIGDNNLSGAVVNVVFNNNRVEYKEEKINQLLNKDILIIDLINNVCYENPELWELQCKNNLQALIENFKGRYIIAVKFMDDDYKGKSKEVIDSVYNLYAESDLDICIIDFKCDRNIFDENKIWDLTDEILNTPLFKNQIRG